MPERISFSRRISIIIIIFFFLHFPSIVPRRHRPFSRASISKRYFLTAFCNFYYFLFSIEHTTGYTSVIIIIVMFHTRWFQIVRFRRISVCLREHSDGLCYYVGTLHSVRNLITNREQPTRFVLYRRHNIVISSASISVYGRPERYNVVFSLNEMYPSDPRVNVFFFFFYIFQKKRKIGRIPTNVHDDALISNYNSCADIVPLHA